MVLTNTFKISTRIKYRSLIKQSISNHTQGHEEARTLLKAMAQLTGLTDITVNLCKGKNIATIRYNLKKRTSFLNHQVVSSIKIVISTCTDVGSISMYESRLIQDRNDNVLEERKLC